MKRSAYCQNSLGKPVKAMRLVRGGGVIGHKVLPNIIILLYPWLA
jgi:hypothetical protein